MRRFMSAAILILVAAALALAGIRTPARAQEGFSAEQQAALDEIQTALEQFDALDSYSADYSQVIKQAVSMSFQGQTIRMVQNVESEGMLKVQKTAGAYNDRALTLTQTLHVELTGGGLNERQDVEAIHTTLIVVDDHMYLNYEVPPELANAFPKGWHDVTGGASAYPGMAIFDILGLLQVDSTASLELLADAVLDVEILEPETAAGNTTNHYRLVLDPAQVVESLGPAALEGMFNADQTTADIPTLIDLLYNDANTHITADFVIDAAQHTLVEYALQMVSDADVSKAYANDPTLNEGSLPLVQNVTQSMRPYALDEPVTIQAPNLGQ